MTLPPSARVAIVTGLPDRRDAHLYISAAQEHPGITIFTPQVPRAEAEWPDHVVRHELPSRGRRLTSQWMIGLRRTVIASKPDLIHIHNEPWSITVQRLLRTAVPVVIHGGENIYQPRKTLYRLRRLGTKSALRRAAGFLNWGQTGVASAQTAGLPLSTPRGVIPASPPSPEDFGTVPYAPEGDLLNVLFVGRLVPEKGLRDLMHALSHERLSGRSRLTVVGSGPDETFLRNLAEDLTLPARFLGQLDARQAHHHMTLSDVIVVPSRDTPTWTEQWGRVAVEAMMTGRCVIASDSGELPKVLGDPRWVFRQNDPASIVDALMPLLDDPDERQRRISRGLIRVREFHPEVLAEQLLDFWGLVLANSREWNDQSQR